MRVKTIRRLSPKRRFLGAGISPHIHIGMFWRWAYSDLRSNTTRGVLAEFLVACALGLHKKPRMAWTSYDLCYRGVAIEVKATAYLQTWDYGRDSKAGFSVQPAASWDPRHGMGKSRQLNADLYVLCLFQSRERSATEMDLDQWVFWVLRKDEVERLLPHGVRRTIEWMRANSEIRPVGFRELKHEIDGKAWIRRAVRGVRHE